LTPTKPAGKRARATTSLVVVNNPYDFRVEGA
jgi:hypothetical protein